MTEEATLDIKKVRLPQRKFAFVRHVGPYMGDTALFERLFNRVHGWLHSKDLMFEGMEAITVYHDDPETVAPEKQRISVGFTIPNSFAGETSGDIQLLDLPESDYVVASYEILPRQYGEAWTSVYTYMGEHGLAPTGLMYESYRNDPHEHPEGKHIVDICVAI